MVTVSSDRARGWVIDLLAGGLLGVLVGWVVAINIAIFSGVGRGYEATLSEVFGHSVVAGVLMVIALVSGPVVGVLLARRNRAARAHKRRGGNGGATRVRESH